MDETIKNMAKKIKDITNRYVMWEGINTGDNIGCIHTYMIICRTANVMRKREKKNVTNENIRLKIDSVLKGEGAQGHMTHDSLRVPGSA